MHIEAAFTRPHDGWKNIAKGSMPTPTPLLGHEKLWAKLAAHCKHSMTKGVKQYMPVIGGRRRYHHRPLTSWLLSNGRTLTLTPDEMEAKTWNRLLKKRHPCMPRIFEVIKLNPPGGKGKRWLWAIIHERLTWPIEAEWELFLDTFFVWRAMEKDALKPAKPSDLEEYLRFLIDPATSDPKTLKRKRVESVLPWDMMNARRKELAAKRKAIVRGGDLEGKIAWTKKALAFLAANKIAFRDLDVSNTARTVAGDRTVITNMAESRSVGKKPGRIKRVGAALALEAAFAVLTPPT